MDILQREDMIKGLPDAVLFQKAQETGADQFLFVSEIQRRQKMRDSYAKSQSDQPEETIVEQILSGGIAEVGRPNEDMQAAMLSGMPPPQPQGPPMGMPPQGPPMGMPPQGMLPQGMPPQGPPMGMAPQGMPMGMPMGMTPQGMASGGVVRMQRGRQATFPMEQTPPPSSIIGQRINNPLNIKQYNQGFLGETGEDSGFVSFKDPMYGVRAADRVLTTYGTKHGINTIRDLINRWAPPSENDTQNYVNYISDQLSIDPDAEVDLSNPAMRARILSQMTMMESRSKYSPSQITEMIEMANTPRPPDVKELRHQGQQDLLQHQLFLQGQRPVPEVQLPKMDIPMPQTQVTTEEVFNAPAQQGGPQSPDELLTAIFGDKYSDRAATS